MRGEYPSVSSPNTPIEGSPPLAWGILYNTYMTGFILGITPTCVGNTKNRHRLFPVPWDHPHLRGEYNTSISLLRAGAGSPPLAWGIHTSFIGRQDKLRITPTCVGNTKRQIGFGRSLQDHPHLRGEYCNIHVHTHDKTGSPPLAWGIRLLR